MKDKPLRIEDVRLSFGAIAVFEHLSLEVSRGEFVAEPHLERKVAPQPDRIFHVPRAQQRPPVHFRRRRIEEEARSRPLQESLQAGECGLAVLA